MNHKPPMQNQSVRGARLGFRLDEKTKDLIERAACLEHRKLTDFCIQALADAARHIIEQHEKLVLSDNDRAVFFDALIHPPQPNERLMRAFAAHKRWVNLS